MKIAIASEDGKIISAHFGRSPLFAVYEIEKGKIVKKEMRRNTFTGHFRGGQQLVQERHGAGHGDREGHKSVAEALQDCKAVISHGMGRQAWEDLRAHGIEMIVTGERDVGSAVSRYLSGELKDEPARLH